MILVHTRAFRALAVIAVLSMCSACGPREHVARGPLFVVLVIDTSGSATALQEDILRYAEMALQTYVRGGPLKVTIINLNERPTMEYQTDRDLYDDDIPQVVGQIKSIDFDARGTDIVSAIELASQYYSYEQIPPAGFKILCFTDGHIDGGPFRGWDELDWDRLQEQGARVAFYFVDPAVQDSELRPSLPPGVPVITPKTAGDDLANELPQLP